MDKRKLLVMALVVFSIMLSSFAFYIWQMVYTPNILVDKNDRLFMIPPDATFKQVQNKLYDEGIVTDLLTWSFLARLKKYDENVKPGVYTLSKDMTNLQSIHLLRSGAQTPVRLTFNNVRKLEELPARFAQFMAFDSTAMANLLLHDTTATSFGFDSLNFISMFLPNTYEVYWTESPHQILKRMKREYEQLWNAERKERAANLGMTPMEVSTLASIVESETNKPEEAPTIAGVYMNRIKRSIPLQADPTLVYALDDFTIRRVLNEHKEIESPYNTYKYKGLPPGPIRMASISGIDAVLNHEQHKFLYFCAKEDFSGYHVFARTLVEHNKNAARFQRALNKERIFR
jgi:UPF0755 protein